MTKSQIGRIIQYIRQREGSVSTSDICSKFNGRSSLEIRAALRRMADSGLLVKTIEKERAYYALPPDASGLIGVYAKPLPAATSSRVVISK